MTRHLFNRLRCLFETDRLQLECTIVGTETYVSIYLRAALHIQYLKARNKTEMTYIIRWDCVTFPCIC